MDTSLGSIKSFLVLHSPRDLFPSYLSQSQRIGHVAVAPHRHRKEARRLSRGMAVEVKTASAELVSDTGAALKTSIVNGTPLDQNKIILKFNPIQFLNMYVFEEQECYRPRYFI